MAGMRRESDLLRDLAAARLASIEMLPNLEYLARREYEETRGLEEVAETVRRMFENSRLDELVALAEREQDMLRSAWESRAEAHAWLTDPWRDEGLQAALTLQREMETVFGSSHVARLVESLSAVHRPDFLAEDAWQKLTHLSAPEADWKEAANAVLAAPGAITDPSIRPESARARISDSQLSLLLMVLSILVAIYYGEQGRSRPEAGSDDVGVVVDQGVRQILVYLKREAPLRAAPDSSSTKVGRLAAGESVLILSRRSGWSEVVPLSGQGRGWVWDKHLVLP